MHTTHPCSPAAATLLRCQLCRASDPIEAPHITHYCTRCSGVLCAACATTPNCDPNLYRNS